MFFLFYQGVAQYMIIGEMLLLPLNETVPILQKDVQIQSTLHITPWTFINVSMFPLYKKKSANKKVVPCINIRKVCDFYTIFPDPPSFLKFMYMLPVDMIPFLC